MSAFKAELSLYDKHSLCPLVVAFYFSPMGEFFEQKRNDNKLLKKYFNAAIKL